MIEWRRPGQLLQIACALPLVLALTGCSAGPSLEERIRALQARGHDTYVVERRARPQTRAQDRRFNTGETEAVTARISRWRAARADRGRASYRRASYLNGEAVQAREHGTHLRERRARAQTPVQDGGLRTGGIDRVGARSSRWQAVPAAHAHTPDVNSPEWIREQAEAAEKDRKLNQKIRSICRGC
jgi:hypothetical protein